MAYKNFVVKVGLSPLNWGYRDFGHLSTDGTWFWNLWELMDKFQATLMVQEKDQVVFV
jgi:hypothetical protein